MHSIVWQAHVRRGQQVNKRTLIIVPSDRELLITDDNYLRRDQMEKNEKDNTVTHVMPTKTGVVTQAPLHAPGQTHVVPTPLEPTSRTSYKFQTFLMGSMTEIFLRVISMVSTMTV